MRAPAPRWSSNRARRWGFALSADAGTIEVTLDTDLNQHPATWHNPALRKEGAWQILSGTAELYFRTSRRLLVLRFPDGRDRIFQPALAAKPDPEQGWSEWRKVDLPDQPQPARPDPEDPLELPYRVRVWGGE